METKANYVAVGAFVLTCIVGLVVSIMWLAGVQYAQEYSYYTTNFKGPVTGLGKGTVTRFNGIDVGRIAVLVDKKIKTGTIEELRKDKHPWIQDYFSGSRGRAALAQAS